MNQLYSSKLAGVVLLLWLSSIPTPGQRVSSYRDKGNFKEEHVYSYSTVVECYATTNSLSSFVRCLQKFDVRSRDCRGWSAIYGEDICRKRDLGDKETPIDRLERRKERREPY